VALPFAWPVRVYWEDTDAGGVVYHSNYVRFMERSRSEWLRHHGIDQAALRLSEGIQFTVVDMQIRFVRPAVYDDSLQVTTVLGVIRGASCAFLQQVLRDDTVLVEASVRVAAIDALSLKPRRLPASLVALSD
jgi:acyl-CoA thioester hydrolase